MLEIKNVTKTFKGLCALNSLDLTASVGEIVGIIGPNGAGKTTTFNVITGFLQPSSGKIIFNGKDITGQRPDLIAKSGIVRTFQMDRLFHDFTVLENIVVGSHLYAKIGFWEAVLKSRKYNRKNRETWDQAVKILEFMGLEDKANEISRSQSHGHQKNLGIGIALAANPKLLLLDEPLAGMNPAEVARSLEIIAKIRERGIGVVLIEHNMRAVMKICDRIAVLNFGVKIAEGSPRELRQNKEVVKAYLGEEAYAA